MSYLKFNQYHFNLEHLGKIKTVQDLIADKRFFHQESGKEREALCKQLFNQLNPKKTKKNAERPGDTDQ